MVCQSTNFTNFPCKLLRNTMRVHNQFMVRLVHVQHTRPLITPSILIQSASFSHDCHAPLPPWQQKREKGRKWKREQEIEVENVPSTPQAFLQLLVLNLTLSEPRLVNVRLAVVQPRLYHTRATFQAVLMINGKQTLPFSHFTQRQIKVFYEGEIEKNR